MHTAVHLRPSPSLHRSSSPFSHPPVQLFLLGTAPCAAFHISPAHTSATTTAASSTTAAAPPAFPSRPKRARAAAARRTDSEVSHTSSASSPFTATAQTSRRSAVAAPASPQPLPSHNADNDHLSRSSPQAASSPPLPSVSVCTAARPQPDKTEGEDTHLLHSSATSTTAAVYDGVGSWSFEQGVDVAAFSRRMRDATAQALAANAELQPQQLLQAVWDTMDSDRQPGSSTACLLRIDCQAQQAELTAASVGDTGFLVLRRRVEGEQEQQAEQQDTTGSNSDCSPITSYSSALPPAVANTAAPAAPAAPAAYYVYYRSMQQLHWFNCPYQLGFAYLPPESTSSSSPSSSSSFSPASSSLSDSPPRSLTSTFDLPSAAVTTRLQLRSSDLIILASDGLFDNLDETEIVRIASSTAFPSLASQLLEQAYERSLDKRTDGPFAVAAKDNNIQWAGGRKDDITVIALRLDEAAEKSQ